jgi:S-adenosylmethionine:tRNA ribosyltransferase-isomerase
MEPARWLQPDPLKEKLLVVKGDAFVHDVIGSLANFLKPGDLLIVNDAATLPASLHGTAAGGEEIELRLVSQESPLVWRAVVFGRGDWQTPTENRQTPPELKVKDELKLGEWKAAVVSVDAHFPRLIEIKFEGKPDELWAFLYKSGKPIQYSYLSRELPLWAVQTIYGARPWSVEMPSAGRPLRWEIIFTLLQKGVRLARLTHGAGLSSTGDAGLDSVLPLRERYDIPRETVEAIAKTKRSGGRVIAIGTSVVRALEGCVKSAGELKAGLGETELIIDSRHKLQVVDGILTGVHDSSESHYKLLEAFVAPAVLRRVSTEAEIHGYLTHEFGDSCLIFR